MSKIYFLFFSILLGCTTGIGFFSLSSYYLKKMYFNLIPIAKKKEFDKNINNWWESSVSKNPISMFKLSLQSVTNIFLTNGKIDKIKILFFSYGFTLSALVVGYFFSNIGSYISIYWKFPIDIIGSLHLRNSTGGLDTNEEALTIFRENALSKLKAEFFSNIIYFLLSFTNIVVYYKSWKKTADFKTIYSFIVITELLVLALKPLTVLTDVIAGVYETASVDYLLLFVINALTLTLLKDEISKIRTIKKTLIWFISILCINFLIWTILSYNSFEYILYSFFIDGICNRFVAFYFINFVCDLTAFSIIVKCKYLIYKKSIFKLLYYLFITIFVTSIASFLTYTAYEFYIFIIQTAIPVFELQPGFASEATFWEYFKITTLTEFFTGEYTLDIKLNKKGILTRELSLQDEI